MWWLQNGSTMRVEWGRAKGDRRTFWHDWSDNLAFFICLIPFHDVHIIYIHYIILKEFRMTSAAVYSILLNSLIILLLLLHTFFYLHIYECTNICVFKLLSSHECLKCLYLKIYMLYIRTLIDTFGVCDKPSNWQPSTLNLLYIIVQYRSLFFLYS